VGKVAGMQGKWVILGVVRGSEFSWLTHASERFLLPLSPGPPQ